MRALAETKEAAAIRVTSRGLEGAGKKLRLFHEMRREADDALLSSCDQMLIHVSLETRRSCPPSPEVLARVEALATSHGAGR